MSIFDDGPLPDWKEIQKWLGHELPWKLAEQWDKKDVSWLDRYIQSLTPKERERDKDRDTERDQEQANVRDRVRPSAGSMQTEVLQGKQYVTISVRLPGASGIGAIRLYATADRLKITGLPNGQKQTLRLPCLVVASSGRATWKQDKLIVRFRRRRANQGEVELFIRT